MNAANINLVDIETEYLELPDDPSTLRPELLGVDVKNLAGASPEGQQLYFSCQVTVEEMGRAVLEAGIICTFDASAVWDELQRNDDLVVIDKELAAELAEITLGIARGLLFACTPANAPIKYILPLMNHQDYFQQDVLLKLEPQ